MDELWLRLNDFFKASAFIDWRSLATNALQVLVVVYAAFWMWTRIKGTQAERLVKGIAIIIALCLVSWMLHLTLITWLLQQVIPIAVVCLVIIFQPEIRRGLGYLGRTNFLRIDFSLADSQKQRTTQAIAQIITAVRELARQRTGALIVIEPPAGERDYLSPGTTINGDVSSNLLLSIFQPRSPLHDGAVVIRAEKLVAAGVILPITDNPKLSLKYGTRHRAALGLSEIYDGLCIVVSEETGIISAANRGMLVRYNSAEELREPLSYFFSEAPEQTRTAGPLPAFFALFGKAEQNKDATASGAQDKASQVPAAGAALLFEDSPDTITACVAEEGERFAEELLAPEPQAADT